RGRPRATPPNRRGPRAPRSTAHRFPGLRQFRKLPTMIVRSATRLLFWHNSLLTSYAAIAPGPTISLVVAFALARVLHVTAMFVPLKILLLVTADGVPSYFR